MNHTLDKVTGTGHKAPLGVMRLAVHRAYDAGLSLVACAERLGIAKTTVLYHLKSYTGERRAFTEFERKPRRPLQYACPRCGGRSNEIEGHGICTPMGVMHGVDRRSA